MKKTLTLLAGLLFCVTTALAQNAEVTPPIAEFLREPPFFFEFRWAGDTLYLSGTHALYRFSPADHQPPQKWRSFLNTLDFVYISPDAEMIIAEDFDSVAGSLIIKRELMTGEKVGRVTVEAGAALPLTGYSQDGRLAAVLLPDWGAQQIELHLYDLEAGALLWTANLNPNEGTLHSLVFTPDGRYLAAWGETSSVLLWDTAQGEIVSRFAASDEYDILRGVNFSPDSRFMYAVASEQMFVWQQQRTDGRTRWERAAVYPVFASFLHLLLSADGQTLVGVTYGEYGEIHLWHVDGVTVTPKRVFTVEDGNWLVRQPAISDDAQYLAAADPRDNIIRIWQLKDARS